MMLGSCFDDARGWDSVGFSRFYDSMMLGWDWILGFHDGILEKK